jgi:hypothetical protein
MLWRVCSHGHHNGADAVHLLRPLAAFRSCGGLEVEIPSVEVEKGAYYYDLSHAAVAPAVRQRMVELPYLHKPGLGVDGPLLASEESSDARGEHVADRTVNATWRFAHELLYLERWAAEGTPRAACGCCSRPLAFGIQAHTDACAGCSEGGVNSTYDPAAITSGIERKAARGANARQLELTRMDAVEKRNTALEIERHSQGRVDAWRAVGNECAGELSHASSHMPSSLPLPGHSVGCHPSPRTPHPTPSSWLPCCSQLPSSPRSRRRSALTTTTTTIIFSTPKLFLQAVGVGRGTRSRRRSSSRHSGAYRHMSSSISPTKTSRARVAVTPTRV